MSSFFPPKSLELTMALIKPHAAKVPPIVQQIKNEILNNKFFIIRYSRRLLSLEDAQAMYKEHEGKPFYDRLVNLMTSGPTETFILARENGIKRWREMMGPTRTFDAMFHAPFSFRSLYGMSNTKNATHGSDSPESAKRETTIIFPEFSYDEWYEDDEIFYRNGYAKFDEDEFIHEKEMEDFPVN
ncbi:nucleoside diphosphate kinase 6-like [Rhodnius prolixus]|uniref:Nucleoside diphosphate kinase n=2 Tax=Rhodnius prolixus TaxID=13249 RepID=R4FJL4_RHOPR